MSMFRSKKLDLGCFVNIKTIRDHTKRKVFAEHEPQRYALLRGIEATNANAAQPSTTVYNPQHAAAGADARAGAAGADADACVHAADADPEPVY